jgi:hypothetical protein
MLRSRDDLVQACKHAGWNVFIRWCHDCLQCQYWERNGPRHCGRNSSSRVRCTIICTFEELEKEATRAVLNESATNRAMFVLSDQYDNVECTGTLLDYTLAPNPSLAFGRFNVVNVAVLRGFCRDDSQHVVHVLTSWIIMWMFIKPTPGISLFTSLYIGP